MKPSVKLHKAPASVSIGRERVKQRNQRVASLLVKTLFGVALAFMLLGAESAFALSWPDATITVDPTAIQTNVGSVFNLAFGTGVTVIGLCMLVMFIKKGLKARA